MARREVMDMEGMWKWRENAMLASEK